MRSGIKRDRAALPFARDRGLGRVEATMARLDAEAGAAVVRPSRTPTAAEARPYLEELPVLGSRRRGEGQRRATLTFSTVVPFLRC